MNDPIDKNRFLSRLENGIVTLQKLTQDLDQKGFHDHPVADRWSMLECLCHVSDFEAILSDRIKRTIAEDNPLIFNADQDLYRKRLFYDRRAPLNEIAVFSSSRKQMIEIVSHLDTGDFRRTCIHNEIGRMTLSEWIVRICGHAEHHFAFMDEKRHAMGFERIGCKPPDDFP